MATISLFGRGMMVKMVKTFDVLNPLIATM
jgi:hypothetical protein